MRAPPCLLALAALAFAASAAAEPLIYEGHLDGLPEDAETVDLRFALFSDAAVGAGAGGGGRARRGAPAA